MLEGSSGIACNPVVNKRYICWGLQGGVLKTLSSNLWSSMDHSVTVQGSCSDQGVLAPPVEFASAV